MDDKIFNEISNINKNGQTRNFNEVCNQENNVKENSPASYSLINKKQLKIDLTKMSSLDDNLKEIKYNDDDFKYLKEIDLLKANLTPNKTNLIKNSNSSFNYNNQNITVNLKDRFLQNETSKISGLNNFDINLNNAGNIINEDKFFPQKHIHNKNITANHDNVISSNNDYIYSISDIRTNGYENYDAGNNKNNINRNNNKNNSTLINNKNELTSYDEKSNKDNYLKNHDNDNSNFEGEDAFLHNFSTISNKKNNFMNFFWAEIPFVAD